MSDLTKNQQDTLDCYLQTMCKSATARELGVSRSTVRRVLEVCERKGHAPWLAPGLIPDTRVLGKVTTQRGRDGSITQDWIRTEPTIEAMREFVASLAESVKGLAKFKPRARRKTDRADVLAEMDVFDAHIGMYAEKAETNDENYDCEIAVKRMTDTAEALAGRYDKPHRIVLTFGGDILHSDTRNNRTEQAGNPLDVDSRFHRVVRYAKTACVDVVQIAASVAPQVDIVVLEGNHDWHSSVWLAEVLDAFFHGCPNINVIRQASSRKKIVFGNCLLTWSHGEKIRFADWPQIIAAEFAPEWGATTFRHHKMGHVHHKKANQPSRVITEKANAYEEHRGLLVEHLQALCVSDAWHASAGYLGSMRGASGFEYHRKGGLMTRFYQHV